MGSAIASKEEVLLGVRIDVDLTFKEHVTSVWSRANQKLHALLTRVSKYMCLQKRRIFMKSFITSQFNPGIVTVGVLIIKSTASIKGPFV